LPQSAQLSQPKALVEKLIDELFRV